MISNISNKFSKNNIALLGFFIVFPFFIFYHTLISFEVIKPIFGSLLGVASFLIVLTFIISYIDLRRTTISKISVYEFLVGTFYLYTFLWTVLNFVLNGHHYYVVASFYQVIAFLGVSLSLYFIGKYIYLDKIRVLISISFLIFSIFLFFYTILTGQFSFMPNRIGGAEDVVATYQSFSGLILIMGLIALVITRSYIGKMLILLSTIVIIFYLGSRSELVAYILGATIYFVFYISIKYKVYMLFILFPLVILFFTMTTGLNLSFLSDSRVFELSNIDSSTSWNARQDLNKVAIQQVSDSPLVGFFGGHTYYFGETGTYAHNIISSWVSFGFIGFILYLVLMIVPVTHSIHTFFIKDFQDDRKKIIFILSLVFLLLTFFSKSVYWTMPSFLWGLMVNRNKVG